MNQAVQFLPRGGRWSERMSLTSKEKHRQVMENVLTMLVLHESDIPHIPALLTVTWIKGLCGRDLLRRRMWNIKYRTSIWSKTRDIFSRQHKSGQGLEDLQYILFIYDITHYVWCHPYSVTKTLFFFISAWKNFAQLESLWVSRHSHAFDDEMQMVQPYAGKLGNI